MSVNFFYGGRSSFFDDRSFFMAFIRLFSMSVHLFVAAIRLFSMSVHLFVAAIRLFSMSVHFIYKCPLILFINVR